MHTYARCITPAGRRYLATGDSNGSALRHFSFGIGFAHRSASDARAGRAACRTDVSAGYFDRSVAKVVSAAYACGLVAAVCRQDRSGQDVVVVRDDRHDVHIVRHDHSL